MVHISLAVPQQRHLRGYVSAFPLVFMVIIDDHNGLKAAHC